MDHQVKRYSQLPHASLNADGRGMAFIVNVQLFEYRFTRYTANIPIYHSPPTSYLNILSLTRPNVLCQSRETAY